jgi:hypothetical protein
MKTTKILNLPEETVIQRYLDLPKFLSMLQTRSIFMSKVSKFEDQLEGGLTAKDFLKTDLNSSILDMALNQESIKDKNPIEVNNRNNAKRKEIESRTFDSIFGPILCSQVSTFFEEYTEWVYVSCWHASNHECSAMWPLYGKASEAVCIFTTVGQLAKELNFPSDVVHSSSMGKVKYSNWSIDTHGNQAIAPLLGKSENFSFEKEIRVVAWGNAQVADTSENMYLKNSLPGVCARIDSLNSMINRVVISPNAAPWFESTIKQICDENDIKDKVEKSALKKKPCTEFYETVMDVDLSKLAESE